MVDGKEPKIDWGWRKDEKVAKAASTKQTTANFSRAGCV